MRYGVLGSLRVVEKGVEIPVPGARQQALLAALVLARGGTVSPEALVDALWEEDPPAGASATLQSYVSRLRTALGHDAVVLEPGGYRLVAHPDDLDLVRFDRLADEGTSALSGRDPVSAERLLREALELWRGTALEGLAGRPFARPEAVRLEERRLAAEEHLCTALLESGAVAEAADRLTRIVENHPLREEARRLHALALYRSNRQSDALASLADARRRLREELGLDPGRPLRELEEQLLRQDPALDPPPAAAQAPQPAPALPVSPPVIPASVLCPILVGRDAEVGVLRTALAEASRGSGGTVVLVADPGAGKSRLVREVLGRSERVLEGRAVAGPAPVPFRPLVEALQAGLRRAGRRPDVGPYQAALGRLVPEWQDPAAPLSPLPHLAEGVLRLLGGLTGNGPLALVIEDLHWADDETLAVLEYLADNLAGERLLLVLTIRADEGPAALRLVSALERRRSAQVLRLPPLTEAEVRTMVAACQPEPPAELVGALVARSHGVPLFVEELLAVADSAGSAVPTTFGQAVRARTGALTADHLRVLQAAAVLGRRFDWRLLAPITGLPDEDVLIALRAATNLQLLQGDGAEVQFRHALHRDAVLSDVFPPERSALAAAALAALRASAPDLPGDSCQQAADLAEKAGDAEAAVPLLVEAGRRAADAGALRTAELLLDRALQLASPSARTDVAELLLDILARAARCDRALDVGEQLLARLDREDDRRRSAGVLVRLAEAATAAADHETARGYLDRARPHLDDEHVRLRADLAEAECDVAERRPSAEGRAAEAARRAAALGESELETRALLLVGRCQRERDVDTAENTFALARARARAGNDPLGALRALAELGSLDLLRGAPADRVVTAAEEAEALGAVAIAGIARLHAAIAHFIRAERTAGLLRAGEAKQLAERYALPAISRGARVVEASLHALIGDLDGVEAALAGVADDDPEWTARAWGNGWAVAFLALERRGDALAALRRARTTGASVESEQSPLRPLAALLEAVDTGADMYPATPMAHWSARAPRGLMLATAAVLAGRRGDRDAAEAAYAQARHLLAPMPWYQHVSARAVAERALADRWGTPGEWLTEAETWLDAHGVPAVAGACRALRPRVAGEGLPLAGALLTPREQEVLRVLATGASNRQIAERLVLSPRTVEKHVERLLQKTATSSRTALAVLAASTYAGPRT